MNTFFERPLQRSESTAYVAYTGSAELEMSLYERSAMIEAVEQSQMQQLAAMGSHFMEMLSIDASDAFYQSFRSKTTLGLEMGSLVAGGYGAVKGVLAFNRVARTPVQVARLSRSAGTRLPKTTLINSRSWNNSINPFKGKTFQEIDHLLRSKGFTIKGPDPLHGKGSYFSPITNRKYYFDYAGKAYKNGITELPHVDVHYTIPVNGIEKQRFPIGEYLYEFK